MSTPVAKKTMSTLAQLRIPVQEDYDWSADPADQFEYVNPVTLNNREILYTNAAIEVTQRIVRCNKEIGRLKGQLYDAKAALEDYEQEVLGREPTPASATKSRKLLDVYLRLQIQKAEETDKYQSLVNAVRAAERALIKVDIDADTLKQVYQTIKMGGEHIQTHLSFVKHELERTKR